MSYILDALRKADAQRERSRLPGLNDRPLETGGDADPGGRSPLLWGVLGVGLVSIGLAAWQLARPPAAPAAPVSQTTPPPPPAPVAPAPAAPQVAAAPAERIEPPPPPPAPAPPPAPVAAPAAPARKAAPASAPVEAQRASRTAAPAQAAAPQPAAPASATAEPSTVPPAGAPRLAITGGVYSTSAAQRMLIVNGQVWNEGSEPAPGVLLEQIRPNQAVLAWRGQRWLVGY